MDLLLKVHIDVEKLVAVCSLWKAMTSVEVIDFEKLCA